MLSEIEVYSPAKINLHLEIGPVRKDGFHSLSSLFQIVSLYDRIHIRSLKDTDSCRIRGNFTCPVEDNLIYRAHRNFCALTGKKFGVEISVEKSIPEGAGLGGGSSNAGTVLKALNEMTGYTLSDAVLADTGAELGSDIPFFIYSPFAAVGGRGEHIEPLKGARKLSLLLLLPDFGISTGNAYRWLDESRDTGVAASSDRWEAQYSDRVLSDLYQSEVKTWPFFNSFTPVLRKQYGEVDRFLNLLRETGAEFAEVSGSGSAMFGIYPDFTAAEEAKAKLQDEKGLKQVLIIELLARFPSSILQ